VLIRSTIESFDILGLLFEYKAGTKNSFTKPSINSYSN